MTKKLIVALFSITIILSLCSCSKREVGGTTPWGTKLGDEEVLADSSGIFSLNDIQAQGEMIMLTMSGPDYYFD